MNVIKKIFLMLAIALLLSQQCYARYLQPVKGEENEEVLVQGASVFHSKKKNNMMLYQVSESIEGNRANFYFAFQNNSDKSINLMFNDLKVTDQNGREIKVIPADQQIKDKKDEADALLIAYAFCDGLQYANAQQAGKTTYYSNTNSNYRVNATTTGSNGWANSSANINLNSSTQGVIYSEAARQQAVRQVQQDSAIRTTNIQNGLKGWENGLKNFYFASNTIRPGSIYSANFQIHIPRSFEKNLEYLILSFNVDGELHTFYYYCGEEESWFNFF